jgi:hypothetical protein
MTETKPKFFINEQNFCFQPRYSVINSIRRRLEPSILILSVDSSTTELTGHLFYRVLTRVKTFVKLNLLKEMTKMFLLPNLAAVLRIQDKGLAVKGAESNHQSIGMKISCQTVGGGLELPNDLLLLPLGHHLVVARCQKVQVSTL